MIENNNEIIELALREYFYEIYPEYLNKNIYNAAMAINADTSRNEIVDNMKAFTRMSKEIQDKQDAFVKENLNNQELINKLINSGLLDSLGNSNNE